MSLNLKLFQEKEKGGNIPLVKESQKRRFGSTELVDSVVKHHAAWKKLRGDNDMLNRCLNVVNKRIGLKYKSLKKATDKSSVLGKKDDVLPDPGILKTIPEVNVEKLDELNVKQLTIIKDHITKTLMVKKKKEMEEAEVFRDEALHKIGNICSEKCIISKDEKFNGLVTKWGKTEKKKYKHIDLLTMLDGMDVLTGSMVAGSRGYFMFGDIVRLNYALIQYSLDFLQKRKFVPIYTPYFMKKDLMRRVAQLEQFEEELYKVYKGGQENEEPKFLIATSEQTICAYHYKKRMDDTQLPKRYAGVSTNFRKEVGAHGRDTLGIFRIHQFEKVEQFCVTSPKDNKSWKMFDEMIKNAEEFWKSLEVPYRVVNIVSGKLNNAAALKYDLECWFPGQNTYRELVSCSNCTDYQSRRLGTVFGVAGKKKKNEEPEYVHMLNATCCATQRAICCLVENHQTEKGVNIPEVLQPYMGGLKFMPFVKKFKPQKVQKKKGKTKK